MNKPAIYQIKNLIDNKVYIGSAKDFHVRKLKHLNFLKHNKHHCCHLQNAWNLYGEHNFEFIILEWIDDINILIEKEQFYLDKHKSYDRNFGYNLSSKAGSTLGTKRTLEQRLKLSVSQKGVKRSDLARQNMSSCKIGKKFSEETKLKLKAINGSRTSWPHADGKKCKCENCAERRRELYRKYYHAKTRGIIQK